MTNTVHVFRVEWRRMWRNKLIRAGLVVALVIPLLYSTLYLWAFWNPYGALEKLPVALVNEDTGGQMDNRAVNFGQQIAQRLENAHDLDWHAATNADAMYGLSHDKYYMVLRIPSSFTHDLLSIPTNDPHKANLDFIPNQGRNYLAGQIMQRAQGDIAAGVAQQFSQQYIQRLLDVVGQGSTGMSAIAQTASQLAEGGDRVKQGAVNLANGVQHVQQGATALQSGLNQLVPGSRQLTNGLKQSQTGAVSIQHGVAQAADGVGTIRQQLSPLAGPTGQVATGMSSAASAATQLSQASQQELGGLNQAAAGAAQVHSGVSSSAAAVPPLQDGVNQALTSLQSYLSSMGASADPRLVQAASTLQQAVLPGLQSLSAGLSQTQQGAASLSQSMSGLQSGQNKAVSGLGTLAAQLSQTAQNTQQLTSNFGQLDTGLASIQSGLNQSSTALSQLSRSQTALQTGANQLTNGLVQAQTGAAQLSSGMIRLGDGSSQLVSGATQLSNGQHQFAGKVHDARATGQFKNTTDTAGIMANPIRANQYAVNPVKQYGPGLAPYFIPLSLWVGALMLFFLTSFREGRWRVTPVSTASVVLGKFGVLWGIGVLQAAIASTVLLYGLHLAVTSVPAFYLFNMVLSITYITIIGTFIGILGSGPGRVIAIVLLVLQLTSSGGTFPLELVPGFFQALHPWLPMTYGVSGLRNIIAMGNLPQLWHMVGMTVLYLAVALAIFLATRRSTMRPSQLRTPDQLVS